MEPGQAAPQGGDDVFMARLGGAMALHAQARPEALAALYACVAQMPDSPKTCFAMGLACETMGALADAAAFYRASLERGQEPAAAAHHRLGVVLHGQGELDAAMACYGEAIALAPGEADYFIDLSAVLADSGRFEAALGAARRAVALNPGAADARNNEGHALLNLNRAAEAVVAYRAAIALRPGYAKAHFGHALALLKCGDYARGWVEYEWRWHDCQSRGGEPPAPLWRGQALGGQKILLRAEQGFGDTLQYARFVPVVAAQGGLVVLEVPSALTRLLRRLEGVSEVFSHGEAVPAVDCFCPMASLPAALGLTLEGVVGAPYLPAPARRVAGGAPVVGLVWAGDPRPADKRASLTDRRRSMPLSSLAPILAVGGVGFSSFQLGEARAQVAEGPWVIADAVADVRDFADTAVRLGGIDLLICVDTSMAHLAGALGVPVWLLSRHDGCWRWLEGRETTPWYPTMRIFRQAAPGDWDGLARTVAAALREWVEGREKLLL